MSASTCKGCYAPVWWVTTAAHGRAMPLDPDPTPDGNVTLNPDGRAVVHGPGQLPLGVDPDEVYMPHHATCPNWPGKADHAG